MNDGAVAASSAQPPLPRMPNEVLPADVWGTIARFAIFSHLDSSPSTRSWREARRYFYVTRAWRMATRDNVLFWRALFERPNAYPCVELYTVPIEYEWRHTTSAQAIVSRALALLYALQAPAPLVCMDALLDSNVNGRTDTRIAGLIALVCECKSLVHKYMAVSRAWSRRWLVPLASLVVYASHRIPSESMRDVIAHARDQPQTSSFTLWKELNHGLAMPLMHPCADDGGYSANKVNWAVADYMTASINYAALRPHPQGGWIHHYDFTQYILEAVHVRGRYERALAPLLHEVKTPSDASWFLNWFGFYLERKCVDKHFTHVIAELVSRKDVRYSQLEVGICPTLRERIEWAYYSSVVDGTNAWPPPPPYHCVFRALLQAFLAHDTHDMLRAVVAYFERTQARERCALTDEQYDECRVRYERAKSQLEALGDVRSEGARKRTAHDTDDAVAASAKRAQAHTDE